MGLWFWVMGFGSWDLGHGLRVNRVDVGGDTAENNDADDDW